MNKLDNFELNGGENIFGRELKSRPPTKKEREWMESIKKGLMEYSAKERENRKYVSESTYNIIIG
jgi:hypothetical protein